MDDPLVLFDEVLSPKHRTKVEGFRCSKEEEVEIFLKKDAWELQDCNMAVTRLFFNKNGELVGYFTLFNVSLPKMNKEKIKKEKWRLPNSEKFYPAIQLHFLGVDERHTKKGIGRSIILEAIDTCSGISEVCGCTFISVQALNSAIGFYERFEFKPVCRENSRYLNMVLKLHDQEED
ncbi:hypothetical protein SRCM100730_03955 [Bacillus velezensis]|uniref:GNAT family N-acetyltransferase n=1 Tax=Bacillus amyloliquefaciens group TaxID=1938374 RepID=UPI0007FBA0E3|nr:MULTISPECIES: GNAT family N-acetyltransferase [Bacillus amyloliquefaciens group]MEC0448210.1 GNAT family N-acetyltransferase [Bacillus velezensis]OBR33848.1 hypothetical protein SRCM100731_01138 [Bacillus velezensis]OCB92626.1 hypothetical protein SRCM100730_03955 [Bacillus velezensis]UZD73333.1 GNAT family N-acetyltransferase [Bacillus siamensis]